MMSSLQSLILQAYIKYLPRKTESDVYDSHRILYWTAELWFYRSILYYAATDSYFPDFLISLSVITESNADLLSSLPASYIEISMSSLKDFIWSPPIYTNKKRRYQPSFLKKEIYLRDMYSLDYSIIDHKKTKAASPNVFIWNFCWHSGNIGNGISCKKILSCLQNATAYLPASCWLFFLWLYVWLQQVSTDILIGSPVPFFSWITYLASGQIL